MGNCQCKKYILLYRQKKCTRGKGVVGGGEMSRETEIGFLIFRYEAWFLPPLPSCPSTGASYLGFLWGFSCSQIQKCPPHLGEAGGRGWGILCLFIAAIQQVMFPSHCFCCCHHSCWRPPGLCWDWSTLPPPADEAVRIQCRRGRNTRFGPVFT